LAKKAKKKTKKKAKKGKAIRGLKVEITLLKKAPEEKVFVLCDGKKLKDIKDLAFALEEISDDVFWHHVNNVRNDFASWIENVFEEKELADSLLETADRIEAQRKILKHIVKRVFM
jgi:hypothetical protein